MPAQRHDSFDMDENHQDANLAFTLVARNEAGRQLWADPRNRLRYVPASFTRERSRNQYGQSSSTQPDSENNSEQLGPPKKSETEPALQFLFNFWPKDFKKGYVLGSNDTLCDALLGDLGDGISEQTLAFTFNERHELIMNVISDDPTWVKYNGQKGADMGRFKWIFPQGQKLIRVKVADLVEFDIVLPKYGINKDDFHQNCMSFLSSTAAAIGNSPVDDVEDSTAVVRQPDKSFYLRGKKLGNGSYGDVYKVLRMPDGQTYAAKAVKHTDSFRQEADMLRKVCKEHHANIIQFVEEWNGGHQPLLIMEYASGGNLAQQTIKRMGFGEITNLANQTLAALVFLHDHKILHRDIKPQNILCVTPNHYKLADFGVSKELASSLSKQGTAEYMAPEVFNQTPYSSSADIWSLGVVLLECMYRLPDGHPGTMGRRWYTEILRNLLAYFERCEETQKDTLEFTRSITISMLEMDADKRPSAQECLQKCQRLQADVAHNEDQVAGIGEDTLKPAHPNRSFPPNSLDDSEGDEVGTSSSSTVRWHNEGMSEAGREPQNFRYEDTATITHHSKASESLLGSISSSPPSVGEEDLYDPSNALPWPPSIGGGKLYDPANVIPWHTSIGGGTLSDPGRTISSVPSTSRTETGARSISDTSMKSRRNSDASADGTGEDGSVTPGRRAPYHPGNEVTAPGRGFFPPSPWVFSPNQVRSGKSEPARRQREQAARGSARGP